MAYISSNEIVPVRLLSLRPVFFSPFFDAIAELSEFRRAVQMEAFAKEVLDKQFYQEINQLNDPAYECNISWNVWPPCSLVPER